MNVRSAFVVAMVGLSLAACGGGMRVNTDYDPAAGPAITGYRTWSWLPATAHPGDRLTAAGIRGAIDNQLASKGFTKVEGDSADFRVSYTLAYYGKVEYNVVNPWYGYGAWYGDRMGVGNSRSNTEWDQGTLAIDIVDGKKGELVYRTVGQAEITSDLSPKDRIERVNRAVIALLKSFPPR